MNESKFGFIGCRTTKERNARGKGISIYEIDSEDNWNLLDIEEEIVNPSFLILDKKQEFLYTVHGDYSEVTGFMIKEKGTLQKINSIKINGINPVHLTLSADEKFLIVAFLQTGNVVSIERNTETGELLRAVSENIISGLNVDCVSHPHQVSFDQSRNRILVPCQGRKGGESKIVILDFDKTLGKLSTKFERITKHKAEVRHLCVHRNGKFIYAVNEIDNTIGYYSYDEVTGALIPMQILSTLPETCTSDGWASGIVLHSNYDTVYVSNRTHNSISWYKVDKKTGFIAYRDNVSSLGDQPRFICLDPSGSYLYVANEISDSIVRYLIDASGDLTNPEKVTCTGSPVCIAIKSM